MSISGIATWAGYFNYQASQSAQSAASQNSNSPFKADSVEKGFLDEINKPTGQRMVDAWLKAHNLTEDDLKNMPPEKRNAILKQMAKEIQDVVERRAQAKAGSVELLV